MPTLKWKHDIFESHQQHVVFDPAKIRLQEDRLLIKDVPEIETEGSLIVPETAAPRGVGKQGLYREGIVVAVGPGNRFIELGAEEYRGEVIGIRRRRITQACLDCWPWAGTVATAGQCSTCDGSGRVGITVPCSCKPGDRVVYERRKEAEFYVGGVRYSLVYESQAVIGVLVDAGS